MKREISIAGSILVTIYLVLVLYLHLDAKHCAEIDGLFCGFGYLIAGFPWNWIFLFLVAPFIPEHQPFLEQNLFWGAFFASMVINSFIFYFVGRFVGKVVSKVRTNTKINGAT